MTALNYHDCDESISGVSKYPSQEIPSRQRAALCRVAGTDSFAPGAVETTIRKAIDRGSCSRIGRIIRTPAIHGRLRTQTFVTSSTRGVAFAGRRHLDKGNRGPAQNQREDGGIPSCQAYENNWGSWNCRTGALCHSNGGNSAMKCMAQSRTAWLTNKHRGTARVIASYRSCLAIIRLRGGYKDFSACRLKSDSC
jgi:hypothetical protein